LKGRSAWWPSTAPVLGPESPFADLQAAWRPAAEPQAALPSSVQEPPRVQESRVQEPQPPERREPLRYATNIP
jgi:hypothetical protein